METRRIVAFFALLLMMLMLLPAYNVNAQDYIEYKIQINPDASATWQITKVSDLNAPIDTWETFQTKIFNLADAAAATTKRPMVINENTLQINTTVSASSKTAEYMFVWQNFSLTQNGELTFGDVFEVNGFFAQLYGEASLQISFQPGFSVKSVTPEPNSQDNAAGTLRWYRTQDLENQPAKIVLTQTENGAEQAASLRRPLLFVGILVVSLAVVLTALFLLFKRRRHPRQVSVNGGLPAIRVESEEDKILNVLRVSGGGMRQSDISEHCRFSKAKTSQLLTELEKSGVVTRYKSGRDKIVTLKEPGVKGEKQQ
jgi:uncharacterized membrane protein